MPEVTSYRHGVPNWIDVGVPDVAAGIAFYQGLFGWDVADQGDQAGGYALFQINGLDVAGIGPLQGEGQPPVWSTYFATDDIDAIVARLPDAGGTLMFPPMEISEAGRMAFAFDPTGAVFGLWEANLHIGCRLVNEANTLVWNELNTTDPDTAMAFYGDIFGWSYEAVEGMDGYQLVKAHGRTVAGLMTMEGDMWQGIPPHWMMYFQVDDTDAAAARAVELGGSNPVAPTDSPAGRFAVVADPFGAHFSVIHAEQIDDPNEGWT